MKNSLHVTKTCSWLLLTLFSLLGARHAQGLAYAGQSDPGEIAIAVAPGQTDLSSVLQWIEDTYGISLSYDTELVSGKRVTIEEHLVPDAQHFKRKEVQALLKNILRPLDLGIKKIERNYYLIRPGQRTVSLKPVHKKANVADAYPSATGPAMMASVPVGPLPLAAAKASELAISGTVTDENGNLLPGVNVFVKGTTIGTVTDADGKYNLNVPGNAEILVFSFIGYTTEEVTIAGRSVIDLGLTPDVATLQEIVVVGYGTQEKSDLTGSIASVKGDDLVSIPVPNATEQLKAKVPGLQITNTGGQPGGTVQIRIRGDNSITGDNSPLVVIDGMIGTAGDLVFLNPADIESLEVLKDASATAIYGARGSNGVIIVTTKKGKGEPKVSFETFFAVQESVNEIDLLSAREFTEIFNTLGLGDSLPTTPVNDTNWQDEIYNTAPIQNYQLTVSGGTDKSSYLLSANYYDQEGIIDNTGQERMTLRMNLNQKLGDRITIGNNLSFTRRVIERARLHGAMRSSTSGAVLLTPPVLPVVDPATGEPGLNPYNPDLDNPQKRIEDRVDNFSDNRIIGNLFGDFEILEGLTYRINLGYSLRENLIETYDGIELANTNQGTAGIRRSTTTDLLVENTLNYSKAIEKHAFDVLAGFTTQEIEVKNSRTTVTGFTSDELGLRATQLGANVTQQTTSNPRTSFVSFLGRVNYSYSNKYLFTVSYRADASSVFSDNDQWGFFPSASVGWNLTQEDIFNDITWLSNLKLRASYGVVGSPNISPYQSFATLGTGSDFVFDGQSPQVGVTPGSVANDDLKWESTSTFNIGLDAGFFEDRVSVTMDYYQKETTDLLFARDLPAWSGFPSQVQNIGSIENEGFELGLSATVVDRAVRWNTNFNIFFNRNEITSLGDDELDELILNVGFGVPADIRDAAILREGEPLGSFFGYEFDGIYQQADFNTDGTLVSGIIDPSAGPGRVKFRDTNGDGEINDLDRDIIGDPNPGFAWGMTNNFTYKNFDLNITIHSVIGQDVVWSGSYELLRFDQPNNMLAEAADYWTPENQSNTMHGINEEPGLMSTRYLHDASFLRLQNLSIGYNIPRSILDKIGLGGLRVYASGQNLLLITDYPGYDPEVNAYGGDGAVSTANQLRGFDLSGYPAVRTYTFGLSATF